MSKVSEENRLLDKLRGYIDIEVELGVWQRFMLHGWFSPGSFANFYLTYSHHMTRLGEEKGIAYYKCVVEGDTWLEALQNMEKYLQDHDYEKLLIYDPNIHFEES